MPQVVEIPGFAELEFPDDMPQEEVRQKTQEFAQQRGLTQPPKVAEPVTKSQAAGRGALVGFLDTILGAPEQIENIRRQGAESLGQAAGAVPGLDFAAGVRERLTNGPIAEDRRANLPVPTSNDLFGAGRVAGEAAGAVSTGDFGQFTPNPREAEQELTLQAQEQRPGLFDFGQALGVGGALATGRVPIARAAKGTPSLGRVATEKAQKGLAKVRQQGLGRGKAPSSTMRAAESLMGSKAVKNIAEYTGRSAEAGVEGLTISLLQDGDPLETAGYAAGGQAAGSLFQEGVKGLFTGGPLKAGMKIAGTAIAAGSLFQLGKDFVPGGKDFILESIETGYGKVLSGIALGALASIAGAGRPSGQKAELFPAFMDSLTSVRRGTAISLLDEFVSEEPEMQGQMEAVTNQLLEDPEFFTPAERRRIGRALTVEDVPLSDTIRKLSEDRKFQRKLSGITPAQQPAEDQ